LARQKSYNPDARLAMILLRSLRYWDQGELARAAGIAPSQISAYDRGERAIPRDVLERIAAAAGFPLPLLDPLLRSLRSFRAAASGRSRITGRLFDEMYAGMVELIEEGLQAAMRIVSSDGDDFLEWNRPPSAEDREKAAELWKRMVPRTPAQRKVLVDDVEEFQSWALCERVAAESGAVASSDPRQALELAELARRIAGLVPGTETWRRRLQGYAWAHVSHARQAQGNATAAGEALSTARKLWKAGEPGDPGLLTPPDLLGEADP